MLYSASSPLSGVLSTSAPLTTIQWSNPFVSEMHWIPLDLTYAAKKLPDDVSPATKARRLSEIVALQETISAEVFAAQVGKHERVLVHGPSKRDVNQLMGRTDGFKTVILPAGVGAVGELVDVTIQRATMATLFA